MDFVMDFIKRIHEYCMKELEVFLKYPVAVAQFSSGLVTNSAPMVSYDELEKLELPNCHPHLDHIQDVFRQNQLLRLFPSAFLGMLFAMHLKHAQFVFCFLLYIVGYFLTCKVKEIV